MPAPPEELAAKRAKKKQEEEERESYYSKRRLILVVIANVIVLGTLWFQRSWLSAFKVEDKVDKVIIVHPKNNTSTSTGVDEAIGPQPQVQPETKSADEASKEAVVTAAPPDTQQAATTQPPTTQPPGTTSGMEKPIMVTSLSEHEAFEGHFCQPWDTDMDTWWSFHPTWEITHNGENATHQCFQPIPDPKKAEMIRQLHWIQFVEGDCNKLITKLMWSSGYGADMDNVIDGLWHALQTREPVTMEIGPWHYADNSVKQKQTPETLKIACPKRNMYCYFLETCKCPATEEKKNGFLERFAMENEVYPWIAQFAMRQRTWLRKMVSDFVRQQESRLATPCTVIHVRRGDVVLHGVYARRYHPIEEYLEFAQNKSVVVHNNILIMTDDANAIPEAKTKFPQYNWMSIDRPRTPSTEAKWEQHLASNDPIFEMVVLQASFQIVQRCDQIIHTRSSFGHTLANQMKLTGKDITQLDMDKDKTDVYNVNNTATKNVTHAYRRLKRGV